MSRRLKVLGAIMMVVPFIGIFSFIAHAHGLLLASSVYIGGFGGLALFIGGAVLFLKNQEA